MACSPLPPPPRCARASGIRTTPMGGGDKSNIYEYISNPNEHATAKLNTNQHTGHHVSIAGDAIEGGVRPILACQARKQASNLPELLVLLLLTLLISSPHLLPILLLILLLLLLLLHQPLFFFSTFSTFIFPILIILISSLHTCPFFLFPPDWWCFSGCYRVVVRLLFKVFHPPPPFTTGGRYSIGTFFLHICSQFFDQDYVIQRKTEKKREREVQGTA